MVFLPLVLASLALARVETASLEATSSSRMQTSADGPPEFWNSQNPKVKQVEETSGAWNAGRNSSMIQRLLRDAQISTLTTAVNRSVKLPVEGTQSHGWNFGAFVCAALLVICPAVMCGGCAYRNYQHFCQGQRDYAVLSLPDTTNLREVLRRELLLMLVCPLLTLLAAPWTSCENGSPSWIYLVYLPVFARSKWVELQLMTRLDGEWTISTWLALALWGPLDHLDWFTDGSAPVQALACDLNGFQITERWASAWDSSSSAGWFVPVVRFFHVSGLVLLVFCLGSGAQQWLGAFPSRADTAGEATAAELCAMHGLAELRSGAARDPNGARNQRLLRVGGSKVVLENVPQLVLQSSFFALVFDELTPLGQAKMLLSVGLGLFCASQKILKGMKIVLKEIQNGAHLSCIGACVVSVSMAAFVLALLFVLMTLAKLYYVFHCDSHLWNWGTGCVEWQ